MAVTMRRTRSWGFLPEELQMTTTRRGRVPLKSRKAGLGIFSIAGFEVAGALGLFSFPDPPRVLCGGHSGILAQKSA